MSDDFYVMNEDGTEIYYNDEPMELMDVVVLLNMLTYTKMEIKKELIAKRDLCDAYEEKYKELNKDNKMYRAEILELRNKLDDYELKGQELDINYWKGIEKSYVDLLDKYFSRIVDLEKENFYLNLRVEELEDDML